MTDLDTPWDISADLYVKMRGVSMSEARDAVILDWLQAGYTGAYTAFVIKQGHSPGRLVLEYVALMMNPADGTEVSVPFKLSVKGRRGAGRRRNPEKTLRDRLIFEQVRRRMDNEMTYDEAITAVDNECLGGGQRDTIEKAYKSQKKLNGKE